MKFRLFFYQLVYLFLLCNCSNQKQSELIVILKNQTIDFGENIIGYGGYLAFCQGFIVGLDMSPSMQPFFCVKSDGLSHTFFRFGNRGQGPNDFLRPYSIQYINDQTIGIFDIMSKTYYEFCIPKENEELKVEKKIEFQTRLSRVIKTAFNQYIGLSFEERMFLLADSTGKSINIFFEYPYQNSDERKFVTRSMAYQGTLAANPSKDKFVYSSFQGEIIHFYMIENSNIKFITKIESKYPLYKERNDGYEGVMFGAEGIIGYIAAYATDKFVYTIFSGKTIFEQTKQRSVNYEGKILRIFDWNGILVKEYELDVPCSYLCVSDDDTTIWAIASNPDITLVYFDLNNKLIDDIGKRRDILTSQIENGNNTIIKTDNKGVIIDTNINRINNNQDEEIQRILELIKKQPIKGYAYFYKVLKNNKQDEETQMILDSIRKNPNYTINREYSTRIDTIENKIIKIQIELK